MKRINTLLLTLLLSTALWAESEYPTIFVPDASRVGWLTNYGRRWTVRYRLADRSGRSGVWASAVKESEVDGKTYVAVNFYERVLSTSGSNLKIGDDLSRQSKLFFRQEGDRVYCLPKEGREEMLVLDFGLNEGENFVTPDGERLTVVETGAFADYAGLMYGTGEEQPKMLRLRSQETGHEDVWIEGVGSAKWGIAPPCVIRETDMLDGSAEEAEVFQVVLHKDVGLLDYLADINEEDYKLVVYQPGEERGKEDAGLCYAFSGDTLCISGVYCPMSSYGKECVECLVTEENLLALSYYGFHIPTTNSTFREIDVKIPGFQPGIYYVYNGGDEPVELICGSGTDGMVEMRNEENEAMRGSGILYDLNGRRMAKPAKGVYIRQGRKVVK